MSPSSEYWCLAAFAVQPEILAYEFSLASPGRSSVHSLVSNEGGKACVCNLEFFLASKLCE